MRRVRPTQDFDRPKPLRASSCTKAPDTREWAEVAGRIASLEGFSGHGFQWVPLTGSTNDDLKEEWVRERPGSRILVAGHQDRGHGRLGRRWIDSPGAALLFSFTWEWPSLLLARLPANPSLLAGLALYRSIRRRAAPEGPLTLKWPNDLMSDHRKLAGILSESTVRGESSLMVIGVGINLRPFAGRPLANGAAPISLHELGVLVKAPDLLVTFLEEWSRLTRQEEEPALLDEIATAGTGFFGLPHRLTRPDGSRVTGVPVALLPPGGALLFETDTGSRITMTSADSLLRVAPTEQDLRQASHPSLETADRRSGRRVGRVRRGDS